MYNPFSLEGKTIMVTGASSGIGRQCAIDCSKMGAKVVAVARNKERLCSVVDEMATEGSFYSYDLSKIEGIKELVANEVTCPVKVLKQEDYESLYRINTLSAFEIVKHLCSLKTFSKGGSIVLISSISGIIARNGLAAYAASKGAMMSASKVMALELARREIRVNTVSPGTILSPLMDNALSSLSEEEKEKRISGFPLGLGQPTDISNACIYLLSEASRWVTGHNLVVDGGYTIQ